MQTLKCKTALFVWPVNNNHNNKNNNKHNTNDNNNLRKT